MQIAAHEYKRINYLPEIQSARVAQPLPAAPKLSFPRYKLEVMTHGGFYLQKLHHSLQSKLRCVGL